MTLEKEREKRKNKSDQNLSDEQNIVGVEKTERKEFLTREKVIRILKEIEKRKRKKKSRFYRIKYWIKNKMKIVMKK